MSLSQIVEKLHESNYIAADTNEIVGKIEKHLEARRIIDEQAALDDLESSSESRQNSPTNNNRPGAPAPGRGNSKFSEKMGDALSGGISIGAKGLGIATGLGALGFGIGAFFTGLAAGDKAQELIGADMQTTKKNMITLGQAFAETPTEGLIKMGIAAGIGAKFGSIKGALGMTFFGAGLGGFFAGLALGDKGAELLKVSGSGLTTMMVSFAEGLNAFSGKSLVAFGGLVALAASPFGAKASFMLPLLGVGVAGFFGAIAGIGDLLAKGGITGEGMKTMMVNLAEGLNPLGELDGVNLLAVGAAMTAIGVGMVALLGGKGLSAIGDAIGKIFGSDEDEDVFTKTAKSLRKLEGIDASRFTGIDSVANSISGLTSAINSMNDLDIDVGDIEDEMEKFAKSIAGSMVIFNSMWNGGKIGEGWMDGISEIDFGVGLKDLPIDKISSKISVMTNGIKDGFQSVTGGGEESTPAASVSPVKKSTTLGKAESLAQVQRANMEMVDFVGSATAIDSSTKVNNVNNSSNVHHSGGSGAHDALDPMMGSRA